jgi:hypothetical protein
MWQRAVEVDAITLIQTVSLPVDVDFKPAPDYVMHFFTWMAIEMAMC